MPENYLASSAALLQTLAATQPVSHPALAPQKSWQEQILSPLGLAAIALLLVGSAITGAAVVSSSGVLESKSDPIGTPTPVPAAVPVTPTAPPATAAPKPSNLAIALLPPETRQLATPSPPPSPSQPATPTVLTIPVVPASSRFYYVVAEYKDDRSLQQARQVVREAYLSQFPQGIRVQVGAFDRAEDAKLLVNQLKQRGIAATVYRPSP
ncbi:MAG: SPOR domain-containing protein [Chloroflexaceae bacterium]|nr:SPOR domain-containing protein [Chloroflexaceae bacterium]